jgi:uncharacterized repeat protein (TIGR03803 family)
MRNMLRSLATVLVLVIVSFVPHPSSAATLKTLVSFTGTNGKNPLAGLVGDAIGNLFGTTFGTIGSVMNGDPAGTVFEVAKTFMGYATTPTTLVTFTVGSANGAFPDGGLIVDVNGNLFGTTFEGGANNSGTVFEVVKTPQGYASTATILVSFNGANGAGATGGLILDDAGNLFDTTSGGGANDLGTVFAIVKTPQGYAGAPTTLVSFNGSDGNAPVGSLIADAQGNLFGTTTLGGINNNGTLFEIRKTANGYASSPTLLVAFTGQPGGAHPNAGLIIDAANGNLFGTTLNGGTFGADAGTAFELVKNANAYASTPTILASLDSFPRAPLIADAQGNLFGTSTMGGENDQGAVFEIAKTPNGYANTATIVVSFMNNPTIKTGSEPEGGLINDANGNLFGTTVGGGPGGNGTVFEITNTGFVPRLVFGGTPGTPSCFGESVLALLHADHNLDAVAQTRGLDNAETLQTVIQRFCGRFLR